MDVRPEVQKFAAIMEVQLKTNDHKGGWHGEESEWLIARLREETDELEEALSALHRMERDLKRIRDPFESEVLIRDIHSQRMKVAREAADVANFSMFSVDVENGLQYSPEELCQAA